MTGSPVSGYRAPSFSVNEEVLRIVQECGYLYDSSFNSFDMNRRYGRIALSSSKRRGIAFEISDNFYELPVSNLLMGKCVLPWGGGGYFRLIPFCVFKRGVHFILEKEKVYLFYIHPWEIDPDQPRLKEVSPFLRFRHYNNLSKTESRLTSFLRAFQRSHFMPCGQYIQTVC